MALTELARSLLHRGSPQPADDALVDPVSQLPTRRMLIAELQTALRKSKHKMSVSLAIVEFSDISGVEMDSNQVLVARLARLLRAWVPAEHVVGHLREREFAIIFCGVPLVEIQNLASGIVDKTRREPSLEGRQREIVTIVGLGSSSRGEGDASHLLTLADIALHYARSTGRGWHSIVDSAFVPRSGSQSTRSA